MLVDAMIVYLHMGSASLISAASQEARESVNHKAKPLNDRRYLADVSR